MSKVTKLLCLERDASGYRGELGCHACQVPGLVQDSFKHGSSSPEETQEKVCRSLAEDVEVILHSNNPLSA